MLKFYKITWVVFLPSVILAAAPQWSLAQCSISNLNSEYCIDDGAVVLTGGTSYYGPGVTGTTFTPATAGVGTHTVYSSNGSASSYSVSTAGSYNPIAGTGSSITFPSLPTNENSAALALGFTFNFFGTNYTNLTINANGYVSFGGAISSSTSQLLPNASNPNNLIAGGWDDLDISSGGSVRTLVSGSTPLRRFVINFIDVRYAGDTEKVTFQIQLHETTNIIEIHALNIEDNGGVNLTQGIENSTGSAGYTLPGRNRSDWTAANDFVSFIPTCVDVRSVTVTPQPSNSLTVTAPATVCPGSGAPVTIASSEAGVLYQLQRVSDNAVLSAFAAGTGSNLSIVSDALAASTNIKVYARNSTTGCDVYLTNTVTVAPTLTAPTITTHPTNSVVCLGSSPGCDR